MLRSKYGKKKKGICGVNLDETLGTLIRFSLHNELTLFCSHCLSAPSIISF